MINRFDYIIDQDEERTPSPLEESAKEPSMEPVTPVEETSEPVAETSSEEVHDDWEKVDVKDDWAASDEEVEKEPPVTIETGNANVACLNRTLIGRYLV